ncbi:hypothetical protein J2X76_004997 [Neorhizobium sp. 2083]|nr:hypothetical protein [Neorhizobium sp. 2083]
MRQPSRCASGTDPPTSTGGKLGGNGVLDVHHDARPPRKEAHHAALFKSRLDRRKEGEGPERPFFRLGMPLRQPSYSIGRMKSIHPLEGMDPEPAPAHRTPAQALLRRPSSFCGRSVDRLPPGVGSQSVSARALLPEKCEEELDRFFLALEMMHQPSPWSTDALPSTDEVRRAGRTGERWLVRDGRIG